jgi:hypothetical protein
LKNKFLFSSKNLMLFDWSGEHAFEGVLIHRRWMSEGYVDPMKVHYPHISSGETPISSV